MLEKISGAERVIAAICFDLGDTLIAEETVVHNNLGQALSAEPVAHVPEVLETIQKQGYKIALIANANADATWRAC